MLSKATLFVLFLCLTEISCQDDCTDPETPCLSGSCNDPLEGCENCDPGYEGYFCDEDIDECIFNNGGCWHNCQNNNGSFTCSCNDGFFLDDIDKMSCIDHDECSNSTDDCEQVCNNHIGGFTCSCYLGCQLNNDSSSCSDEDECQGDSDCSQICNNLDCTEGRYNCSCYDGYKLGSDDHTCTDINECELGIDQCEQVCTNTIGSYICSCQSGCSLSNDSYTCKDEDECQGDSDCSQICNNFDCTEGRYNCSCYDGYKLGSDDHTCTDIDECELGIDECEQVCTNTIGSYTCSCQSGCSLSNDSYTCEDEDECQGDFDCSQICNNLDCTEGRYNCSCYDGYKLGSDDHTCTDINECELGIDQCEQVCTNTIGSYTCSCQSGCFLSNDNYTCKDEDECQGDSDCSQICNNLDCTEGRYNCSCYDGYELGSDDHTCIDIDECKLDIDQCEQVCTNTIGSYTCSCQSGCSLSNDNYTCEDIDECSIDFCNQNCTNMYCTEGQYTCSCDQGYELGIDGHTCFDVDECELNICSQTCTNQDGSFSCGCVSGCALDSDEISCIDIDECSTNTSKCEHSCISNAYCTEGLGYTCSCNNGYILADNGYSCIDIDECANGTNNCDQICSNTIGSYECHCKSGCQLNEDGRSCSDIDECGLGIDECQQHCTNEMCTRLSNATYVCSCSDGFSINDDLLTCTDIDECQNGDDNCMQICNNQVGKFNCSCYEGYKLDQDGFTCNALPCENEIWKPLNGQVSCTGNVTEAMCEYSCDQGFYLEGNKTRTCQANSHWSGDNPQCLIYTCPELEANSSSLLLQPCMNVFDSVCVIACQEGEYVNGNQSYYTQTCVIDNEKTTYWEEPKTCEANVDVCNPNPCYNGGSCNSPDGEAMCSCGPFTSGKYCEETIPWTPNIPILTVNRISDALYLSAKPHSSITISIITDASIEVLPSWNIEYSPNDTQVSFTLKPTMEGFFKIEYFVSSMTATERIEQPQTTHFIVKSVTDGTTSLFDEYNITDSVLLPGCCLIDTGLQLSYCSRPGQEIKLSSSCEWKDEYKTSGITFIHSGELSLPVSIVGIDSFPSTDISPVYQSCEQCEYNRSKACLSSSVTPNDVVEMLKQQSLFKTFIYNIKHVLPSLVAIGSSNAINTNYATADTASYYASFTSAESFSNHDDCQNLNIMSDDFLYVIKSNIGMNMNISRYNFETEDFLETICFAMDLCRLPQSPLHISIPNSLKESARSVIQSHFSLPEYTVQDVRSISLSSYGIFPSSGVASFWNGSSMVDFEIKTFDIGVNLIVAVGQVVEPLDSPRLTILFSGIAYGRLDETTPLWLSGQFDDVSIYPLLGDNFNSLYLSAKGNNHGIFVPEQATSSNFHSGVSMELFYDSDMNGYFNAFFQTKTNEQCLVQTYVSWNSFSPYYSSLRSECLILMIGGLAFPDLTTTITIPAVDNYWPTNPQLAIRAKGLNLNDRSIVLGQFVSIPTASQSDSELQLDIYSDRPSTAVLKGANLKFLGRDLEVDMNFAVPSLSFSTTIKFYDKYQALVEGSAQIFNSWNDIILLVKGGFMNDQNSLQTDLNNNVYQFLKLQAQFFDDQINIAEANVNSSFAKMNSYYNELHSLESKLNGLILDVEKLEFEYQSALNYTSANDSIFQTLAADLEFDSPCEILDCTNSECQFEVFPTICDKNITYPLIEPREQVEHVSIVKQKIENETMVSCTQQNLCYSFNGITWIENSLQQLPLIDSLTALPYSYIAESCSVACQTEEITLSVLKNIDSSDSILYNIMSSEDVLYDLAQVCFVSDSCQAKLLEEPCTTENYDCQDARKVEAIRLSSGSLNTLLVDTYKSYTIAVAMAISAKALLDVKRFEKDITERELNITRSSYYSSIQNYNSAQYTYNELVKKVSLESYLLKQYTSSDIFTIDSITFAVELESSHVLPLIVNYSIPAMAKISTIELVLDERVPLHIMMDAFTRSLVDSLLPNFNKNQEYTTKIYEYENAEALFEKNCFIMDELYLLVQHFDKNLLDVQNNFEYSISVLETDLERLKNRTERIITSATNLTESFESNLIATLLNYTATVESYYSSLNAVINEFLYISWLEVSNEYANVSVAIGDSYCFSFTDCLKLSIDLMTPLVSNDEKVNNAYERLLASKTNLWKLSERDNLTASEAREYISPVLSLLNDLKESNYWCATKPNITKHPLPEVYWRLNNTGVLSCGATSEIPVAYKWWKDGALIANEMSVELVIQNIESSDYGVYTCEAYNDVGSSYSLPSTVRMYILPIILTAPAKSLVTYSGNEGGSQLMCQGESLYSYYWSWIFRMEEEDDFVEIDNSSNVLFMETPDKGYYQCVMTSILGSATSDPTNLTITKPSVVTIQYPMLFLLMESREDELAGTSKLHHSISNDEVFINILQEYLEELSGEGSEVSVDDISIVDHVESYYIISFVLSSKNLTNQTIVDEGLSSILQEMRLAISNLEEGMIKITENVNFAKPIHYSELKYSIVNDSLIIFTKQFSCPSGYQLDESFIVCVPCSQGEYGDTVEVQYRSEIHNVYYPVIVPICSACTKGYYQKNIGATQCIKCPDYHTTSSDGAVSVDECEALCLPETYSEDGVHNCQVCSNGFYQPLYGSKKCLSCEDVPSDNIRCLSVSPTVVVEAVDTTTLIIATAVTGGVIIICFVLLVIIIFVCGIKMIRRKRARKEDIDEFEKSPFRKTSFFEASSIRRGMPIREPKSRSLKVQNPIYISEVEAIPLQNITENLDQESQHGRTEVTFIDDVEDDTKLLLPQETQEKDVTDEEKVASEIVRNAISSAIHSDSMSDKTPLLNDEEEISELADVVPQDVALTKELEDELATQLPQRLSTVSKESEEIVGLETIPEESSSEQIVVNEEDIKKEEQNELQDALLYENIYHKNSDAEQSVVSSTSTPSIGDGDADQKNEDINSDDETTTKEANNLLTGQGLADTIENISSHNINSSDDEVATKKAVDDQALDDTIENISSHNINSSDDEVATKKAADNQALDDTIENISSSDNVNSSDDEAVTKKAAYLLTDQVLNDTIENISGHSDNINSSDDEVATKKAADLLTDQALGDTNENISAVVPSERELVQISLLTKKNPQALTSSMGFPTAMEESSDDEESAANVDSKESVESIGLGQDMLEPEKIVDKEDILEPEENVCQEDELETVGQEETISQKDVLDPETIIDMAPRPVSVIEDPLNEVEKQHNVVVPEENDQFSQLENGGNKQDQSSSVDTREGITEKLNEIIAEISAVENVEQDDLNKQQEITDTITLI